MNTPTPAILVTYGSRHGATAGIAEEIADALREDGFAPAVVPAREVTDVTPYDAVVIGGSLHAGHWNHDALRCARRNAAALAERPVWFFSSGPLDTTAEQEDLAPVPGAAHAMAQVHARGHVTFGGCVTADTPGVVARVLVRSGRAGDFRNPPRIRRWAHRVAGELRAHPGPAAAPDHADA
ncbi:flavodoxin [Kitasatospora sp. NE20-6]|uniref:flavodoxin domain-containing protein n=1 Tax=Kitasatospora sp. NE20-6 TaxID=2859066 RepID=UPI0034DC6329